MNISVFRPLNGLLLVLSASVNEAAMLILSKQAPMAVACVPTELSVTNSVTGHTHFIEFDGLELGFGNHSPK